MKSMYPNEIIETTARKRGVDSSTLETWINTQTFDELYTVCNIRVTKSYYSTIVTIHDDSYQLIFHMKTGNSYRSVRAAILTCMQHVYCKGE